jgi:hypothetical protein
VEAALSRHPDVRQAAVVVRQQPDGVMSRLDGYVATSSPALTEEALRAHLRAVLPDYMVPATLTVLPGLPVNANGKIDRGMLPAPAVLPSGAAAGTGETQEPATSAELVVLAILREVLGVTAIGRHDDIFALGGHSLQVPQIAAFVAERTGAEVPLREIFLEPTAAGIAAAIGRPREAAPPAITRVDRSARRGGQVAQ